MPRAFYIYICYLLGYLLAFHRVIHLHFLAKCEARRDHCAFAQAVPSAAPKNIKTSGVDGLRMLAAYVVDFYMVDFSRGAELAPFVASVIVASPVLCTRGAGGG